MATAKKYYSLRFRCNDGLHNRGDIVNCADKELYIGQTPECGLKLPPHPEFIDTCYAVIVRDGDSWNILRQESKASIIVNNSPLGIAHRLSSGDRIVFDKTDVRFSISEGEPKSVYIQKSPTKLLFAAIALIIAVICGMLSYMHQHSKSPMEIFADEQSSIYSVRADSLMVIVGNDTVAHFKADHAEIGTGFVTSNGYFVTARHCIEFWLSKEDSLRQDTNEITYAPVKWAIKAEDDSSIRMITKLTISTKDGTRQWHCTSDDFVMDKEHDNICELGSFSQLYLWRSIVSKYENLDAELGDVAVMKWNYEPTGNITLAEEFNSLHSRIDETVYSLGFPQPGDTIRDDFGRAHHGIQPGRCFSCDKAFDEGFSGGPVFTAGWFNSSRKVVGIVSQSYSTANNKYTLIVPVSQVHKLIKQIETSSK